MLSSQPAPPVLMGILRAWTSSLFLYRYSCPMIHFLVGRSRGLHPEEEEEKEEEEEEVVEEKEEIVEKEE